MLLPAAGGLATVLVAVFVPDDVLVLTLVPPLVPPEACIAFILWRLLYYYYIYYISRISILFCSKVIAFSSSERYNLSVNSSISACMRLI